jgi:glutathione S-transferase
MLTIYGGDLSSPANKVRMVANALGLEYEYKRMNIRKGETRTEEYLRLHPAGKIPVVVDDDFTLFESNAIIKYLCVKNNSGLYPGGLRQRAIVDQWLDFISIHIGAAMGRVLFNRVFTKVIGIPPDEQSLKDGLNFLDRLFPVVDAQLNKNNYMAGEKMTIADISLIATIDPCEVAKIDLAPYEHINRWRAEMKQQEFYTKCYKEYGEPLKQMAA